MQKKLKDLKLNKKKIGNFYICELLGNKNEEEYDFIHSNFMCSM